MSIDEELIAARVPVSLSSARMSKQGVRESVQRAQLCLVPLSADVDDDALASGRHTVVWNGDVDRGVRGRLRTVWNYFRLSQRRLKPGQLEMNGAGTDVGALILAVHTHAPNSVRICPILSIITIIN